MQYYRLSGNGNDFLALAEPECDPAPQQVRAWCRRGLSLGVDGVFALRRRPDSEPGGHPVPVVEMRHWNPDGGEAELCLNGSRCAGRLAFELGWAEDRVALITPAGRLLAERDRWPHSVRIEVPLPDGPPELHELELPQDPPLRGAELFGDRVALRFARVGVPHVVVEVDEKATGPLGDLDIDGLGRWLRHHEAFAPAGANVNFVVRDTPDRFRIRTWERGVEGETLACGTGTLAAAWVALGDESPPAGQRVVEVGVFEVHARGGFPMRVEIEVDANGQASSWHLCGDARLIARGEITAEAEIEP